MRAVKTLAAAWGAVILFAAVAVGAAARTDAQEGGLIPPAAVCNPDAYGGYTWRWDRCNHELHNHRQYRGGAGTDGHTVRLYKREARAFRAYCGIDR